MGASGGGMEETLLDLLPSNVSASGGAAKEQPRRRREELRPRRINQEAKRPGHRWAVLNFTGVSLLFLEITSRNYFIRGGNETNTSIMSRY